MNEYKDYFNTYSSAWLKGAYENTEYDYPVGYHRLRILKKALKKYDLTGKKVLDIGCGGGDISIFIASQGADVVGIDMSESMLEIANNHLLSQNTEIKSKIEFRYEDFSNLSEYISSQKFDCIIAFGLIGYLEDDKFFFEVIKKISRKNTLLFLSCRNELFNMTSISENTIKEINNLNAINLISEIDSYYDNQIEETKCEDFLDKLSLVLDDLKNEKCIESVRQEYQGLEMPSNQPRQSTPKQLRELAVSFGFELKQFYGVHPHLLLPRLNKKLPPRVFNLLSDALCVFEEDDISLIWSSVFVGEFVHTS